MKKLFMPLLLVLTAVSCQAQTSHLDEFYHKFDTEGAETTKGSINLSLLMNFAGTDSSNRWLSKVTLCRFMEIDPAKTAGAGVEWSALQQSLKDDHFEEWMSVRHGRGMFKMLSCDRKDGQEDVVCLATGEQGGGVFLHVRGRFTAADRAKIQAALQNRES